MATRTFAKATRASSQYLSNLVSDSNDNLVNSDNEDNKSGSDTPETSTEELTYAPVWKKRIVLQEHFIKSKRRDMGYKESCSKKEIKISLTILFPFLINRSLTSLYQKPAYARSRIQSLIRIKQQNGLTALQRKTTKFLKPLCQCL